MKQKLQATISVLVLLVLGYAGCGNPFVPGGTGSLNFAVSPANISRTILPLSLSAADLLYDYNLSRTGYVSKTGTGLDYATLTALTIEGLDAGDWDLEITAKKMGIALFAKTGTVGIVAGANTINWELQPLQTGSATASINVDLSWPTANADAVNVYLSYDVDFLPGNTVSGALGAITSNDGTSTANVSLAGQVSGTAYLSLQFTLGGVKVAMVQELVQLYDSRASVGSFVLTGSQFSTPPADPSGLAVTLNQTTGNPKLTWTDNSNTETGFRVFRDGEATALVEITTPGTVVYDDTTAGTAAHTYEVRAFNTFGESSSGSATASWAGSGNSTITFTLSNPVWQTIQFSEAMVEVNSNDYTEHTLTCTDPDVVANGTDWSWWCINMGFTLNEDYEFTSTLTFTPSEFIDTGDYIVCAAVTYNGVRYSGSFKIRVKPATVTKFSVTYSSVGADSGSAPVDTGVYNTSLNGTDKTIVLGNTGGLSRANCAFLGWTKYQSGNGPILTPGSTLSVTANTVLYPAWLVMHPIGSGTFNRDSSIKSTVSAFLIGLSEVTAAQWDGVMKDSKFGESLGMAGYPAFGISWYQALAFCNTLSLQQGLSPVYTIKGSTDPDLWDGTDDNTVTYPSAVDADWSAAVCNLNAEGYRLPTQMEWMWAAMGGLADSQPGNIVSDINTNGYSKAFAGSDGINTGSDYVCYDYIGDGTTYSEPLRVMSLQPNELGLYDLSGNVFEWCQDGGQDEDFNGYTDWPAADSVDYLASSTLTNRLMVGGSYADGASYCTLSASSMYEPYLCFTNTGFRVVRKATASSYVPRSGLVVEFLMDSSFNTSGNTITRTLNPDYLVTDQIRLGSGQSFDATSNSITYSGSNTVFSASTSFSISLWFYPQSGGSGWQYLTYGSGPNLNYGMVYSAGGTTLGFQMSQNGNPNGDAVNIDGTFTYDQWHHAVMVYDAIAYTLSAYMDGSLVGTADASALSYLDVTTGRSFGSFSGYLDDCRVYNRALLASEIQTLYKN